MCTHKAQWRRPEYGYFVSINAVSILLAKAKQKMFNATLNHMTMLKVLHSGPTTTYCKIRNSTQRECSRHVKGSKGLSSRKGKRY